MTDEELAQMTAELLAATPLEDQGHEQTCTCDRCQEAWIRGGVYQDYAWRAVRREMPRLLKAHIELRQAARALLLHLARSRRQDDLDAAWARLQALLGES